MFNKMASIYQVPLLKLPDLAIGVSWSLIEAFSKFLGHTKTHIIRGSSDRREIVPYKSRKSDSQLQTEKRIKALKAEEESDPDNFSDVKRNRLIKLLERVERDEDDEDDSKEETVIWPKLKEYHFFQKFIVGSTIPVGSKISMFYVKQFLTVDGSAAKAVLPESYARLVDYIVKKSGTTIDSLTPAFVKNGIYMVMEGVTIGASSMVFHILLNQSLEEASWTTFRYLCVNSLTRVAINNYIKSLPEDIKADDSTLLEAFDDIVGFNSKASTVPSKESIPSASEPKQSSTSYGNSW